MKAKRVLALVLCAAMVLPSESLSVYAMAGGVDVVTEETNEVTPEAQGETVVSDMEESASDEIEDAAASDEAESSGEKEEAEVSETANEELILPEKESEAVAAEFYSESSPFLTVDEDGTLQMVEGQKLSGTTVTIPKEAKKIPKGIFNDVISVRNIRFAADSELTEIEAGAFEGSGITEIELPAGVTELQNEVFKNSELKKVTFLGEVTSIGDMTFSDTKLEKIDASYVVSVGSSAFENCSDLTEVRMPRLKIIGTRAFRYCTGLQSGMVWNTGLESIGNEAFKGSGFIELNLTVLTREDLSIGAKAFEGCTSLRKVSLPKQLPALSTGIFKGCISLADVKFDEYAATERVGEEAFSGCKALDSIALPASVKVIDVNAFGGCEGLDTITINNPSPDGDDFSIAQNAFPSRSKSSAVMEGYGGKVREYAESRGYIYRSLFARYNITSYKNEHAVITLNKTAASSGEEVQVTVTTDDGYTLKDEGIKVTSKLGTQDSTLVSVSGNKYVFSFVMPNGAVTISALVASVTSVTEGELSPDFGTVNGYRGSWDADKRVLTLDKTGRETDLIIRLKDNVQAGAWLLNYQTSNKEVATISSQGRICARGLGTATITASLRSDANKKISFKVKVEQDVQVDKLELNLGSPYRARLTRETIDGQTYPVVEYKKATIAGNAYSFKVSVKATEVESDSNVIVNSTWTSVDQNIATVSRAKSTDNGNIITVKKGVEGETMISVTVRNKDAAKTERTESFIVRVVDGTPRLADTKVTVNTQSEIGTGVDIVPVYGYQIFEDTGLQLCKKVISTAGLISYEPVNGFQVTEENGRYHIRTTADFKVNAGASVTYKGNSGLYLQGEYSKESETGEKVGTGELFVIPVPELTVVNKALAPTLKVSGKINLFYNSKADAKEQGSVVVTQNLKKETVTGYKLVSNENYKTEGSEEVDSFAANFDVQVQENGSALITRSSGELVKKSNKAVTSGYLYIYYDGYKNPVKKKITVPTCTVKPEYQLFMSTVTASTYRKDQKYVIYLRDKKTKQPIVLDENDSLSFDYGAGTTEGLFDEKALSDELSDGKITIQVKGTPRNGKAVILVKKDTWNSELRYTFSLKTTKTHPTVKFQNASLVLNQLCPEQEAATGVLVGGDDAEFAGFDRSTLAYTGSKKYREDAEKLLANMKLDGTGVHVSLPEGVRPGTYSFRVMPQIQYKGTAALYYRSALSFQVTVKTNNPEMKLKKSTYTLNTRYAGQETVESTYSIRNIPAGVTYELKTDEINLTPVKSKSLGAMNMKGHIHVTLENGIISVQLDESTPVSGFNYEYYVDGLAVQVGEKTVPVKRFKVAVKGITTAATVSVTGKGTINPVNAESNIVYTAKVNSVNSEIGEVRIWELQKNGSYYYDGNGLEEENRISEHFTVSMENGKAVVRAKDTSVLKASTNYRIRLAYVLKAAPDQYVISKTFTITPKQTLPKIQTDKTSAYLYAGQNRAKTVEVKITQTSVPEAEIESVDFAKGTPAAVKKAYRISYDAETGIMTLRLVNPARLVLNKKYTVTFETRCEKQMENSAGRTFKLDITVRK